jgi:hypothetical protein
LNWVGRRLIAVNGADFAVSDEGLTVPVGVGGDPRDSQHFSNWRQAAAYDAVTQIEKAVKEGRDYIAGLDSVVDYARVIVDPTSRRVSMADVFDEITKDDNSNVDGYSGDLKAWSDVLGQLYKD